MSAQFTAHTDAGDICGVEEGAGFPVVLLHGGPGLSDYMGQLDAETTDTARSDTSNAAWPPRHSRARSPWRVIVADAVAVLDSLGIDQAIIGGHSWGGHLAEQVAVAHPERVAALLLIDPPGSAGDGGLVAAAEALEARILPSNRARADELAEYLATHTPTDDDVTEALALRWPGYFADPPAAPAFPATMRLSLRGQRRGDHLNDDRARAGKLRHRAGNGCDTSGLRARGQEPGAASVRRGDSSNHARRGGDRDS